MIRRLLLFFPVLLLLTVLAGSIAAAQAGLNVNSLRIGTHPDKTRVVVELSQSADFRVFYLPSPPRVVVDLPSFAWNAGTQTFPADSLVKAVRQGPLQPGISRIVLETDNAVSLQNAFIMPRAGQNPDRVVIDFTPSAGHVAQQRSFGSLGTMQADKGQPSAAPPAAVTASYTNETHVLRLPEGKSQTVPPVKPVPTATVPAAPVPDFKGKKPLIVIDPGHGGQDPGALSASGHREKDVTLAAAKDLKTYLENTGRYKVQLTRDKDVFIKLQDRVKIARRYGADLFISLHADSIDKPGVRGASIYTLSNTASDAQTAKLAARENRADLIAGVDLSHEDKEVADILIDLAMRDTMNQSKFFANTVVKKADTHGIDLLERPHRYAGFAVLKAPDTPSVLIEMGFMSNSKEAAQLSSPAYRKKLVAAIGNGIDAYFSRVQKNAQK